MLSDSTGLMNLFLACNNELELVQNILICGSVGNWTQTHMIQV